MCCVLLPSAFVLRVKEPSEIQISLRNASNKERKRSWDFEEK